MIAPSNRLLLAAVLAGVPLGLLMAAPGAAGPVALAAGGCVALALLDAVAGRGRVRALTASYPPVVRMSRGRASAVPVEIGKPAGHRGVIRVGVPLPPEVEAADEALAVALPEAGGRVHVEYPCTPLKRGRYSLDAAYIETGSPLGLWRVRERCAAGAELRVYPDIHGEQRQLAALFLNRGLAGLHAQRVVGRGREFEKLREYIPGDSYEDIHWKATAKRHMPITKVYQVERTQDIYVVIDNSRLSARPAAQDDALGVTSHLERYLTAALVLALAAEKQGDRFGLAVFNDRPHTFIRAGSGKAHYGVCREALYTIEPVMTNPGYAELMTLLRMRLPRRALLVFLTSLEDPVLAEEFSEYLDIVARRHLVLVNMLTPDDTVPLFSQDRVQGLPDIYSALGGHIRWRELSELRQTLQRRGVAMQLMKDATLCPDLVSQYINVKQRQLL